MASTVWKGHLTFGLVSLPVRLFSAARGESISFNQLHQSDNSRVKQVLYCQAEDRPVPREELVKGFEYEKGKYVVVDEEEIKAVAPETSRTMQILEFVKMQEIDPVYLDASYYVAPDEGGETPYALMFEALRKSGYAAIAKVSMHNREHVVILRPGSKGIFLHTMYYSDEVRAVDEFRTDTSLIKDKELELATMLINSLAAPFEPTKYKDTYRENIKAMIEAKVRGKQVVQPAVVEHRAPVINIMDALKQSLDQMKKKPVQSAPVTAETAAPAKKAATGNGKRSRKTAAGESS
ncbi:MAG TPA: Ku protein [Terriglobales bacterium]|nr:Ku protein [Terriglobales bacterium]